MKATRLALCALIAINSSAFAAATEPVQITLELPKVTADNYHRPYLAVWLESPDRQAVATLALWKHKEKWLPELRQWWRKVGRQDNKAIDAISGATHNPGSYQINWNGLDNQHKPIAAGAYVVHIEVSRENGGREYIHQAITLGENGLFALKGTSEIGAVTINVNK